MSYMITHFWPGGTEAKYKATVGVVHPPRGLPAGQVYHAAGPTEDGYLVVPVWESHDACNRFMQDTLL